MGFAGDGGCAHGDALEVVDDAGGGSAQMSDGKRAGVGGVKEVLDLGRSQVGREVVKGIAFDDSDGFAAHRRTDKHAQGIETRLGAIAVGVGDRPGLQHAVVVVGSDLDCQRHPGWQ